MQREMHFNKISIINLKLWSNCLDNWIKVKEAKATLPKLLDKNSDTLFFIYDVNISSKLYYCFRENWEINLIIWHAVPQFNP